MTQKIICIVGPTAAGKSSLAITLAQKFNGEIINADSRQFYKQMDIGTSKPSKEEQALVPHHLLDIVTPNQSFNAGDFSARARDVIDELYSRKKLPVVVGGTGLYVKTLLFGIFEGPPANPEIRTRLHHIFETQGGKVLHDQLLKVDPVTAQKTSPNDPYRLIRALEVFELTGKPISSFQAEHQFAEKKYDYLKIGVNLPRDGLYKNINKRVDEMVASGLEQEVRDLAARWTWGSILSKSIGYEEWQDYLAHRRDLTTVIELIKQHTRNFAKRQLTWFKKETDIKWVEPSDPFSEKVVEFFLNK